MEVSNEAQEQQKALEQAKSILEGFTGASRVILRSLGDEYRQAGFQLAAEYCYKAAQDLE